MADVRPALRREAGSGVRTRGSRALAAPASEMPDRRFHHPGYVRFTNIVEEEVARVSPGGVEDGLVLLRLGAVYLARRHGCSARTLRRRWKAIGISPSCLVRQIRMRVVASSLIATVPVSVLSNWLGFASADVCRKFIRKEFGFSVRRLRQGIRRWAEVGGLEDSASERPEWFDRAAVNAEGSVASKRSVQSRAR